MKRQLLTPEQRAALYEVEDNAGAGWFTRDEEHWLQQGTKPGLDQYDEQP